MNKKDMHRLSKRALQAMIDQSEKLAQAQNSIGANLSADADDEEVRSNIRYQRDELGLTDRQYLILLAWYSVPLTAWERGR